MEQNGRVKVLEASAHVIFTLEAAGGPARRFRRLTPGIDSLIAANLQRRLGDAYHTHADGP
jgi:hypothetical protein